MINEQAELRQVARHLNTLAGMVTGIVLCKSCRLPTLAGKAPDDTPAESRSKRFSRWIQNESVTAELYFLPFIQILSTGLPQSRPLDFIMDSNEVGRGYLALVISVVYSYRALPIAWVIVRGSKGQFPADTHMRLLREVVERLPLTTTAQFLGDCEFDSLELPQALDACDWTYVWRTAKNTRVQVDGEWVALACCYQSKTNAGSTSRKPVFLKATRRKWTTAPCKRPGTSVRPPKTCASRPVTFGTASGAARCVSGNARKRLPHRQRHGRKRLQAVPGALHWSRHALEPSRRRTTTAGAGRNHTCRRGRGVSRRFDALWSAAHRPPLN
jgi:hypothetical protein